jgi:hypothetical protein
MHFPRKLKRCVEQPTGFTLGPGAKNFTQKKGAGRSLHLFPSRTVDQSRYWNTAGDAVSPLSNCSTTLT